MLLKTDFLVSIYRSSVWCVDCFSELCEPVRELYELWMVLVDTGEVTDLIGIQLELVLVLVLGER